MAVLVKTANGITYSSVKTKNGIAVASLKTINGIDVTSSGGTSYRYYRLFCADSGGAFGWNIREIEIFTATTAPGFLTDNTADLTRLKTYSASSSPSGFNGPGNAFDDDAGTAWSVNNTGNGWVKCDITTAAAGRSANVRTEGIFISGPLILQGSTDDSSWTDLASITSPASNTTYTLAW